MNSLSCKELTVAAIRTGTVLDHISAGSAPQIIQLLGLDQQGKKLSVGMHLPSSKLGTKDLIKIEDWELSPDEANKVAIISPHTSVAVIKNYEVTKKFVVKIPKEIDGVICCPNSNCISNHELVASRFSIQSRRHRVRLRCHFCQMTFSQEDIIT